jgi:hypothetical protein
MSDKIIGMMPNIDKRLYTKVSAIRMVDKIGGYRDCTDEEVASQMYDNLPINLDVTPELMLIRTMRGMRGDSTLRKRSIQEFHINSNTEHIISSISYLIRKRSEFSCSQEI